MLHVTDNLIEGLAAAVGERHVLVDDDVRAPFEIDWTRRYSGTARAVVRPADAQQVAAVVAACREHGAPIVPQGGNTGMVGAGVPRGGEVVLSTSRLTELGPVDRASAQVRAGAGVTLARVQESARAAGLDAGVDFAARDSATVGGLAATNAGGIRAMRYGTVRARIAGLQAVLADGSIIERPTLLKDNAGYDLSALLVGSEGTLGIITAVRWRLVAPAHQPRGRADRAAVARPGGATCSPTCARGCPRWTPPSSCRTRDCSSCSTTSASRRRSPCARRCTCCSSARPWPTRPMSSPRPWPRRGSRTPWSPTTAPSASDCGAFARPIPRRSRPRAFRTRWTSAYRWRGWPSSLTACARRWRAWLPRRALILFGHLGDGNVHVNVLDLEPDDYAVDEAVLRVAAACDGTISAEHGVGVAKARWLELVRSPGELRAMAQIKRALDPDGLLNPGVMLP